MTDKRWTVAAGLAGLVSGAACLGGFVVAQTPDGTESVQQVAQIYAQPGAGLTRDLLLALSGVALLAFATVLRERMWEAGARALASLVLGAAVLAITFLFGWIVPDTALNTVVGRAAPPDIVYALFYLADESVQMVIIPVAVLVVATSVATLAGKAPLPRWFGVAGLVISAPMALGSLSMFVGAGIAQPGLLLAAWSGSYFGLTNLWLAVAGATLAVMSMREVQTVTPEAIAV